MEERKRSKRKVSLDVRFGRKVRRPAGTKLEPLYLMVKKETALFAKTRGAKEGSVSLFVEGLILSRKRYEAGVKRRDKAAQ